MPELFELPKSTTAEPPKIEPPEIKNDEQAELRPPLDLPLNAEQRAAVEHGDGPLLVVAGAGTGKTRVITERIRHLLESDPTLPGEAILGLTFTEKAAGEMKYRVARAVGERGERVCLETFNAFGNALLVERNPELKTLETEDHWILLRRNLAVLALERYRRLAEPGQFLGDFVGFFSRCQDELVTPEGYERYAEGLALEYARERGGLADDERRMREERIAQAREIARAYRASDRLLRERNLLTFGMQLLDAVRAFDDDPEFAARQQARFRYILVDEFQDTNYAQIELLWRLAGKHRNIVAVGDDAQGIYTFRGASFGAFATFLRRFAGVVPGGGLAERFVQPLVENYRSTARILRVAEGVSDLLERSPLLPKSSLKAHKQEGEKVRIAEFATAADEARWIADEILRLHGAGEPWGGFAALYRIHGHRQKLVEALDERGIPFRIRNLTILDQPVVRDMLAYLRLLVTPSDNAACARVLAAPAWGLEPQELVRLSERAKKNRASLWDEFRRPRQNELPFAEGVRQRAEGLPGELERLRETSRRATAAETFDELAEWLELAKAISREERRYVQRLRQFLREWQPKSETARLAEFVEYLEYFRQAGGQINLDQEGGDAVQLMTVHAAKGLEFDHVFVLRLTQRCFPMGARRKVLEFPEALTKSELPKGGLQIEEERRLFYVALTRAREGLTLTTVVHRYSKPSPFLEDILGAPRLARTDVEQLTPAAPAPAGRRAQAGPDAAMTATLFDEKGDGQGDGKSDGGTLFDGEGAAARSDKVHSRIGAWALTYRPPVFEPLKLSVSAIESYQKCPQKYLFRDVWDIAGGPHAATTFGNVMHTTIRQLVAAHRKGLSLSFEELETIFRREWTSAGFEDSYQEECYKRDGLEQLRAFYESWAAAPPDVLAQEKRFTLELENNVQVTGRIDQVNVLGRPESSELEIVDYKTGKPKTETQAQNDLQLGVYALAAKEEFGSEPVRLVYYNLQNNERVAAVREDSALREMIGEIQETAADIRAREFPPRPDTQCKSCDYRLVCPAMEQRRDAAESAADGG